MITSKVCPGRVLNLLCVSEPALLSPLQMYITIMLAVSPFQASCQSRVANQCMHTHGSRTLAEINFMDKLLSRHVGNLYRHGLIQLIQGITIVYIWHTWKQNNRCQAIIDLPALHCTNVSRSHIVAIRHMVPITVSIVWEFLCRSMLMLVWMLLLPSLIHQLSLSPGIGCTPM